MYPYKAPYNCANWKKSKICTLKSDFMIIFLGKYVSYDKKFSGIKVHKKSDFSNWLVIFNSCNGNFFEYKINYFWEKIS